MNKKSGGPKNTKITIMGKFCSVPKFKIDILCDLTHFVFLFRKADEKKRLGGTYGTTVI